MARSDRKLNYLPTRSEDARWVSCRDASLGSPYSRPSVDLYGHNSAYSAVQPPPPRPPRLAALMAGAGGMGLNSSYYDTREVAHFSCWRLRWCALCLVIAVALQASTVGSHLQSFYGGGPVPHAPGAGAELASASLMLSLLLIGLWSLLSQLLLWSDSAVMKVPSGVHVSDAHKDDVLTTTI